MREIKFRIYNTKQKKMHNHKPFNSMLLGRLWRGYKDNLVFMQYTDLKDKNRREIYEGDIVKWKYSNLIDSGSNLVIEGAVKSGPDPRINLTPNSASLISPA